MIIGVDCEMCVSDNCDRLVGYVWVWDGCVPGAWVDVTKLIGHGVCLWGGEVTKLGGTLQGCDEKQDVISGWRGTEREWDTKLGGGDEDLVLPGVSPWV